MIELHYNLTQSDLDNYDFVQIAERKETSFYERCQTLAKIGYFPFSPIQRMGDKWYQQWIRFN